MCWSLPERSWSEPEVRKELPRNMPFARALLQPTVWLAVMFGLSGCSAWKPKYISSPPVETWHRERAVEIGNDEQVTLVPIGLRRSSGGIWVDVLAAGRTERLSAVAQFYPKQVIHSIHENRPMISVSQANGPDIDIKAGIIPPHAGLPNVAIVGLDYGVKASIISIPLRSESGFSNGTYLIRLDVGDDQSSNICYANADLRLD